jgi:hypothetical protein
MVSSPTMKLLRDSRTSVVHLEPFDPCPRSSRRVAPSG